MPELSRAQKRAIRLLRDHGGARYGTMHAAMMQLRAMGLTFAYDHQRPGPGRWTWRLTAKGKAMLAETAI